MVKGLVEAIQGTLHQLGISIIVGIANNSYYICLFCAFFFLLLYIMGHKKYAKFVPLTYLFYTLLQALKCIWI